MVRRKIDRLYFALQEEQVFTTDDLRRIAEEVLGREFSTQHLNSVYLRPLQEEGLLRRPRRGLYIARAPGDSAKTSPYLIASKLRSLYYLGYNSALEVEGADYSTLTTKYVVVRPEDKFEPFEFDGTAYQPVLNQALVESSPAEGEEAEPPPAEARIPGVKTSQHAGHAIRVSTPARTFIDCVDRPELAGGWEYCLKSLSRLKGVDPDEIPDLLDLYDNQMLLRKVGYVLEMLSQEQDSMYYGDIDEEVLEALSSKVKDYKSYLDRDRESKLADRWNLYVPTGFQDHLEGI